MRGGEERSGLYRESTDQRVADSDELGVAVLTAAGPPADEAIGAAIDRGIRRCTELAAVADALRAPRVAAGSS